MADTDNRDNTDAATGFGYYYGKYGYCYEYSGYCGGYYESCY
jgi:hypothetical protein